MTSRHGCHGPRALPLNPKRKGGMRAPHWRMWNAHPRRVSPRRARTDDRPQQMSFFRVYGFKADTLKPKRKGLRDTLRALRSKIRCLKPG